MMPLNPITFIVRVSISCKVDNAFKDQALRELKNYSDTATAPLNILTALAGRSWIIQHFRGFTF